MSDDMMGMGMDAKMLETADPFDREFMEMMIVSSPVTTTVECLRPF